MKRVAILQSNYIPWKGYFDIIGSVDEFIFYDQMQYTRRDWRNRNLIKTQNGLQWLSIPVFCKDFQISHQKIADTLISDTSWNKRHWEIIKQYYKTAPHFIDYKDIFEELYLSKDEKYLVDVNYKFINAICKILNIKTKLSFDINYGIIDGKTERLVDLVKKANGNIYLSGPAAKDYIIEELFTQEDIAVEWMDYSGYPEYPQQGFTFEHGVSIIDLIFNCGPAASRYMKINIDSSDKNITNFNG